MFAHFVKTYILLNRVVHGSHFWLHFWIIFDVWQKNGHKMKSKMKPKMLPWTLWNTNISKMKQKWVFYVRQVLTVLGMLKLRLTAVYCDVFSCQWVVTKMPTPTICTVMLQELTEHHCTSQQQCFQQCIQWLKKLPQCLPIM